MKIRADSLICHFVTRFVYLPLPKNRKFIGRSAELEELDRRLFREQDCQKMALVGLGGIGKTQAALGFAHAVVEKHVDVSVFWVPATSRQTFEQAFEEIARVLKIHPGPDNKEDVVRLVQRHLSATTAGRWLLVIDNADDTNTVLGDDVEEGLLDYLPESGMGMTIFTSRNHEVAQLLVGSDVVKVERMDTGDAKELLKRSLIRKQLLEDGSAVEGLLEDLDYLPLAITQAAAYVNVNQVSISEYLGLLGRTEADVIHLMSKGIHDNTRHRKGASAVATTWIVSFTQIVEQDEVAADLLRFVSRIEWKAIPESILPMVEPKARTTSAIGMLCAYSFLVERPAAKVYDMHRLVHLAIRVWDRQYGYLVVTQKRAILHLAQIFPSDEWKNREVWREYLPHAARMDKDASREHAYEQGHLCYWVGRCQLVDGKLKEAEKWLQKSYACRERLAADHPSRLASQHTLARVYEANGQIKEALQLLEHIVKIEKGVLAEDHPSRLASQHELAGAYQANGQIKEALQLLEYIVKIQEGVFAEDHPLRLASQHTLARVYLANGQIRKAVQLLEYVVKIQEGVFAEDHPSRLASQHALAGAYQANGQIQEAVQLLEYVVKTEKGVFAEDHPSRLASEHTLAGVYEVDGQTREAVQLLEYVVKIHKGVFAEDHPSRLASQHELARAYQANEQIREAVQLLEHVVMIEKRLLERNDARRLVSIKVLEGAYRANGQVEGADELLQYAQSRNWA